MGDVVIHQGNFDARGKRFALVVARYNEFIANRLLSGAEDCLLRHGASPQDVEVFRTPGSFEIPLVAREVARAGRFDAVVCLGAVIRGETPHFDFVAAETSRGVGRVSLEMGMPVIYGIITAETLEQAIDRAGARTGNRGAEAALAAIEMANLLQSLAKK